MNQLIPLLKSKQKILLLCHAGTDVDSIAAAAILYFSIPKNNFSIACIDHVNLSAKAFAKNLNMPYSINPELKAFDSIILLDFNKLEIAGELRNELKNFPKKNIFAFDHHIQEKESIAPKENSVVDEKVISTTELLYYFFKKNKLKLSKKAMQCVCAGIITDSANFSIASKNSFNAIAECLGKSNSAFQEILELFRIEKDFSEKIAALKAAKRCKIFKIGEFIIATSQVDSFESTAANALVRIGADVSFVCAFEEKNDALAISARASGDFLKKTRTSLAKVFNELEEKIEGKGGGHDGAAAFSGKGIPETALEDCVKILFRFLLEKNPKIQLKEYN